MLAVTGVTVAYSRDSASIGFMDLVLQSVYSNAMAIKSENLEYHWEVLNLSGHVSGHSTSFLSATLIQPLQPVSAGSVKLWYRCEAYGEDDSGTPFTLSSQVKHV